MPQKDNDQPPAAPAARAPYRVVAIGASAGGVQALRTFFEHTPCSAGLAYVVILHLSPEHESQLATVIQRSTSMPVRQITDDVTLEPDHVYVIAPKQTLTVSDGRLHVAETGSAQERRAPIDLFFRALAEDCGPRAIAVVLSGTGTNGSSGLKHVRAEGGFAIAQDPAEAEYPDMPRHAIGTGMVDCVLPTAAMGERITRLATAVEPRASQEQIEREPEEARSARSILSQLSARTGHDFSEYKSGTVFRRMARRVAVHNLSGLAAYAEFVREHPEELNHLLNDLLISVTHFFRDPDAFATLDRKVIPRVFDSKGASEQVRVWVPGCATGEEAYSIAMLLVEYATDRQAGPTVQVFATDLDQRAVRRAREGLYTAADLADVTPARVRRFFSRTGESYAVKRELRDLVLFATHNVLKDPPFSHLDFVACRNLLIYLNRNAQQRLLQTVHFALGGQGYLFVGSSESMDGANELFVPIDKPAGLYQARSAGVRIPVTMPDRSEVPAPATPQIPPRVSVPAAGRVGYADLHVRLLEEYGPPSALVNEEYTVLHLSERAGRYLHVVGGEPSRNILSMIRPELRMELRASLAQAVRDRVSVEASGLELRVDDRVERVTMTVRPVLREGDPARGLLLVLFQGSEVSEPTEPYVIALQHPVRQLEEEVARANLQLQVTVGQYETQAEELRASNEELQAVNEELRSAVEELETSKEELQSVNEELVTVNQELKNKIDELSHTNNDFHNLINSTDIGTIFLDRFLRVKLFTPRAREIFNLIPMDVGRPLLDISSSLPMPELQADVEKVLDTLQSREREVQSRQGRWYLMRILPYRTSENRIDGVVMIFFDITARRGAEQRLAESQERVQIIIDSASDFAIFTVTSDNIIDSWNTGAEKMFGYTEAEIIGKPGSLLFTPEDRELGIPEEEIKRAAEDGRALDERWHLRKDGSRVYCSGVMTALAGSARFAKIARDLTEQQHVQRELQRAHAELESRVSERTAALAAEVAVRRQSEERSNSLVRQLVTVQEDERRRIARDLHDELGQRFTALRMQLENHRQRCAAPGPEFEVVAAQAEEIDAAIEYLAWQLRPAILDDIGLVPALHAFLKGWSAHVGVVTTFDHSSFQNGTLTPDCETHLYRIAQETMNNVAKHARASSVDVLLGRRNGSAFLIIEDDGTGFDTERASAARGLGLSGMHERARLCGGSVEIESTPGKGTTVFVTVPVRVADET